MKFICKSIKSKWKFIACLLIISVIAYACHEKNTTGGEAGKSAKPLRTGQTRALTLYGYNYTNTYIDSYSVNGQGGGNLYISGPGSGGGGSVCCVTYTAGYINKVTVRWQVGGCMFDEGRDKKGKMAQQIYHFYKEAEVTVEPKVPDDPHYFEVHIYPDEHVEAIITETTSMPRLDLKEDREINSNYQRCPNGEKPKR